MKTPRESGLINQASEALKNHNRRILATQGPEINIPISASDEEIRLARESGFIPVFVLDAHGC